MIDNIDNNPSSTTTNDSFHGTSVSLARQAENEGEMWMLSESVDTSTRTGKKEAYRIIIIHSAGNSTHHK